MSTLEQWTAVVCADLGLEPGTVDMRQVLDLAREVAHGVDRPAAPLTAYLMGVAVGRGRDPREAADRILQLVQAHATESKDPAPGQQLGNLLPAHYEDRGHRAVRARGPVHMRRGANREDEDEH
jgi:hypothetical protein